MTDLVVVTAASKKYNRLAENLKKSVERFYPCIVYDVGGLGFGKKIEWGDAWENRMYKPVALLDALKEHKFAVWMDADTELLERIDEVDEDYDIGVTVRKKREQSQGMGTINSAVVFAKSKDFCQKWLDEGTMLQQVVNYWSEQTALNLLLNPEPEDVNKTINVDGFKVKLFPIDIYNKTYYDTEEFHNAYKKIVHYKTQEGKNKFK